MMDKSSMEQGPLGHEMPSDSIQFSLDVSQMPDNPPKNPGHRRAYSEILTRLDDVSFDGDLGVVAGLDEIEEDILSVYLDMDKFNSISANKEGQLSTNEKPQIRHHHSQSMDGASTIKPEMLMDGSEDGPPAEHNESISSSKLAELARVDPKRAKRIWANKQSAARSKERKMRYICDLERKVQMLHTETTSLSAQSNLLQRDTNNLASENSELKMQLQTIEQQVHLQDALNDALREEIQHLKVLTGQTIPYSGPPMSIPTSYGAKHQYFPENQVLITPQQLQHLHFQSEKQQHQFQYQQLQHQ